MKQQVSSTSNEAQVAKVRPFTCHKGTERGSRGIEFMFKKSNSKNEKVHDRVNTEKLEE